MLNILSTDLTLASGTAIPLTITSSISAGSLIRTLTTAVTMTDPCTTTTITTKPIADMSVSIGSTSTRDFTEIADS